ncbi:hypothetical protein QBC36DRAFT_288971 [Triangularia setosa]|uniref:Uncharacterized protein n=1 Tax=Triangularia setosa TaxID=2587417 RepID=A0AAN7A979_9PEZI|nr:hypothetical protein QBC36DRAFT_288971 [Podospora setosa]
MPLAERKPPFLRDAKASLSNILFEGIQTQEELTEVHEFLFNYKLQEKWYSWVRDTQNDEDKNQEKEQKKRLKQEHALFQCHKRELEARLAASRAKEEERCQAAYLEEI